MTKTIAKKLQEKSLNYHKNSGFFAQNWQNWHFFAKKLLIYDQKLKIGLLGYILKVLLHMIYYIQMGIKKIHVKSDQSISHYLLKAYLST